MNRALKLSIIFLVVTSVGVSVLAWREYSEYVVTEEEGLVYIGIFNSNKIDFNNVVALSKPSQCNNNMEDNYEGLPKDVVKNFIEVNRDSAKPFRLTALEGKVPIVSWEDTKQLYKAGTEEFSHPKGNKLMLFSRVGFNKEFSNAIACISIYKNKFRQGILIFLKKTDENWDVVEVRTLWSS